MVHVRWIHFIHLLLLYAMGAHSVSIDNDIIGEPDIECLDQEIRVWVKTRKDFSGRIYAKGKSEDPECAKNDFATQRTKKPHFDLPLGMCGMKSLRSMDPRGMYYGITLVISFHPLFITKVDQAFHVKCFFEEANRGLTAELGVSMIPTTAVEARHSIPGCTYSIHRSSIEDLDAGRPAGTAIQFAKVGDKVLHQWHCDDQMFGVLINNCYVTDGVNKKADVIDSRGCPTDPILITGIRYSPDLQRAYAESQVFKFADRPGVWFFCQIQMCMKKDGMCDGVTPPGCATTSPTPRGGSSNTDTGEPEGGGGDGEDYTGGAVDTTEESRFAGASTRGFDTGNSARGRKAKTQREFKYGAPPSGSTDGELNNDYTSDTSRDTPYSTTRSLGRDAGGAKGSKQFEQSVPSSYGVPSAADTSGFQNDSPSKSVTVFGPAFSPMQELAFGDAHRKILGLDGDGGGNKAQRSEVVTTEFETNDDLAARTTPLKPKSTASPTSKRDYVDYDSDVTIPPNLTDLLANLPQDINAESLQKMFRDSVTDRRALMRSFTVLLDQMKKQEQHDQRRQQEPQGPLRDTLRAEGSRSSVPFGGRMPGEKIDTMHVSWDSHRLARDLPLTSLPEGSGAFLDEGVPRIAGQLLIYDLDETPPQASLNDGGSQSGLNQCAVTRQGLMVLAMGLGSVASTFFFVILVLYLKLRSKSKSAETYSYFDSRSMSFDKNGVTEARRSNGQAVERKRSPR